MASWGGGGREEELSRKETGKGVQLQRKALQSPERQGVAGAVCLPSCPQLRLAPRALPQAPPLTPPPAAAAEEGVGVAAGPEGEGEEACQASRGASWEESRVEVGECLKMRM